jgi:acyl-ACP thioesterase
MRNVFEYKALLTGMDVDGRGFCKPSALLNELQVAAMLSGETGGFGYELLQQRYGAFWMLVRSWYRLKRPLRYGETVTVRTWHRENRGAMMYRDYDIFSGDELVGESVSGWVLANRETRKLMSLSAIPELQGTGGGALCKQKTLSKLRLPPSMRETERRLMRYSDSDINGHVNNTRYADFACDAVESEQMDGRKFVSEMQIGYLAECRPGETICIRTGEQEGGHYVCGLDESGKSRFETALFFGEVPA